MVEFLARTTALIHNHSFFSKYKAMFQYVKTKFINLEGELQDEAMDMAEPFL